MRTSLHDIHLPARRIFALLISVATLIATLPTAARTQAEPPGALDLATLPGTQCGGVGECVEQSGSPAWLAVTSL